MKFYPLLFLLAAPLHAALPEPDTVFYGRIMHLGGGEEYVLTSGELKWTVQPPAGSPAAPAEFTTTLSSMKGGTMSYQIRVPHYLQVSGTTLSVLAGFPVNTATDAQPFRNASITVNGHGVRLADPAGISFDASAITRGSFRRLDLIVDGPLPDADGDGLPDWWETKYHLDLNHAGGLDDPDHDGVNNLAEYRAGTNPTGDNQDPHIPAEILVSLPIGGKAIPVLRAVDADSRPEQLTYTVGTVPPTIEIGRIGHSGPVSTFTQADLNAGKILLTTTASAAVELIIPLSLRDETPAHPAATAALQVSIASEATLWDGWGLPVTARPASLPAIQDGSKLSGGATLRAPSGSVSLNAPSPQPDVPSDIGRFFIGSPAADTLLGSSQDDLILAGDGDSIRLGSGEDRLLVKGANGSMTVVDFSIAEHDVIDLRGLLQPTAGRFLPAYLQLSGTDLKVDANGDGSGFTDLTIHLTGASLPKDIADLWDTGSLETGSIAPQTTLFLTTSGIASEENLSPATVTLRRRGEASAALDVPVTWSGTATMGRDLSTLPNLAHFAGGQKSVSFIIQPLADDEREPAESVQITVGINSSWILAGGSSTSTLSIADLPTRVWLEVAERTAYRDSLSPAQFLVRRSGPMASSLTVQLTASGRAVAGLDYRRLPASVTFAAAQDVIAIDVLPMAFAVLARGAEDVVITVKPDASYLYGISPQIRVMLVEHVRTFGSWMTEHTISNLLFAKEDSDHDGMNGLLEFAFNRNPAAADAPPIKFLRTADGRIGLEYHRWSGAPELTYRIQHSSNLRDWTDVPDGGKEETDCEVLPTGIERVQEFLRTAPTNGCSYLRIRVDRAE
jgi:hypothetical protein